MSIVRRFAGRLGETLSKRHPLSPGQLAYQRTIVQAGRDVDDEEAVTQLREDLAAVPAAVIQRLVATWGSCDDFLMDRGYRLLVAVRDGSRVVPMDPVLRPVFDEEAVLGRAPVGEAFALLAERQPELARLDQEVRNGRKVRQRHVEHLIGPKAGSDDPRLQGIIARKIALMHFADVEFGWKTEVESYFRRVSRGVRTVVDIWPGAM